MAKGKQAKILTDDQFQLALGVVHGNRYPSRDLVIFLLSHLAGLRAKEIALIEWSMVLDATGNLMDVIHLEDRITKGGASGGEIPMAPMLKSALWTWWHDPSRKDTETILCGERSRGMSTPGVAKVLKRLYNRCGFEGCSSHSGRAWFITNCARNIPKAGGSLADVQQMARHKSLATTQIYIRGDSEAKRRLVDML